MSMPIRQFEPSRAVEIIASTYGSGYRLGGRLVLTAAHLLGDVGSDCEVRDKLSFGKEKAQVAWKAQGLDIALIELPEKIADLRAITLGKLPEATAGEKLTFQMYAYPLWARTQREQRSAAGGRQIEGIIYLSDRSPDGLLVLEAQRLPPEGTAAASEWAGASGAAIVCDELVIAVQSQHQNPSRPASLEASPLWAVYADKQWRQLLEKHGINPEPEIARLQTAEVNWREICRNMLIQRQQLTTNLLEAGGTFELKELYVPLGLVEKQPPKKRSEDVSPEFGSQLYREENQKDEEKEKIIPIAHDRFFNEVLKQGISPKSRGQRIALTGEAGSGKTTLLQKIAFWILDNDLGLPIWVPLGQVEKGLMEYLKSWLTRAKAGFTLENLEKQCDERPVWLLLDGLDERSNPTEQQFIDSLQSGWVTKARMVLSSRLNTWEIAQKVLSGFDVYRNLDFAPEEIKQFVHNWFTKIGNTDLGERLLQALNESGKERIRDLVRNPLRCSLLCRSWQSKEGTLPDTKAQLYEQFVEAIYQWKEKDWTPEPFASRSEAKRELNQALGKLARRAIDQEKFRFLLRHDLVTSELGEPDEPICRLALKLSWLNPVGKDPNYPLNQKDVYAFYHPTFEEYFAALAIDDWDYFLPRGHRSQPVKDRHHPERKYKTYRIFEPQWKQVLLLWMGREGGELAQDTELKPQKEAFIQALTTFKDGCKGFYTDRAFLLAAEGIAEFKDCTRADAIFDRLMQWKFGSSHWLKKGWANRFDSARVETRRNLATNAFGSTDLQREIRTLVRMIKSTQDASTRWSAAERLGKIHPGNKTEIWTLVRMIKSTQDESTRWSAAESLGQIDPGNETEIRTLVRSLESTQDASTCWSAAERLGKIGTGNETAIRALVRMLESTQDASTRRRAAESLGKIDPGNETAIRTLVRMLKSTQDESTRRRAAESLGQIGTGNETAIRALVRLLESTRDEYTRWSAAESLGKIDPGNETAIRALLRMLESTQDQAIRWSAAESLGKIDPGNETAIRALVRSLRHHILTKEAYNLMMKCAEVLPYPEFYQAFHSSRWPF